MDRKAQESLLDVPSIWMSDRLVTCKTTTNSQSKEFHALCCFIGGCNGFRSPFWHPRSLNIGLYPFQKHYYRTHHHRMYPLSITCSPWLPKIHNKKKKERGARSFLLPGFFFNDTCCQAEWEVAEMKTLLPPCKLPPMLSNNLKPRHMWSFTSHHWHKSRLKPIKLVFATWPPQRVKAICSFPRHHVPRQV